MHPQCAANRCNCVSAQRGEDIIGDVQRSGYNHGAQARRFDGIGAHGHETGNCPSFDDMFAYRLGIGNATTPTVEK